jgi:hypothetical protein
MSNQPEANEQQANADTSNERSKPPPAILKAENDTKITDEDSSETQEAAAEVHVSPPTPGRFRRAWEWTKRKSSEASLADWAMVFFTFIIAASTIVFTVYARRQWQEMASGGEDTKNLAIAAKKQAEAATKAADAADEALRRNTEAFKLDEQARVRISIGEHGWNIRMPRTPLVANYTYSNVGKTQCDIVGIDKHVVLIAFRQGSDIDNLTFDPTSPIPIGKQNIVLQPSGGGPPSQQNLITAFNYSEPPSGSEAVDRGEILIASYGCIEYKDIFGDLHWTDFCNVRQSPPNQAAYATCAYQCKRDGKKAN